MTTEVADGIFQLTPVPGVNTWALRGADGWTLVDAGLQPTAGRLVRQLRRVGIGRGDVERLVLTHAHLDHAGGAALVRTELGVREVLVGAADLPHAREGRNPPGTPPGPGYPALPMAGEALLDVALDDELDMRLVATPGHTGGHLAVHLPRSGVVIGGDAVFNVFRLAPSPAFLCSDAAANAVSVGVLADLDPTVLLLAHGRPVDDDPAGRLRQLLADT